MARRNDNSALLLGAAALGGLYLFTRKPAEPKGGSLSGNGKPNAIERIQQRLVAKIGPVGKDARSRAVNEAWADYVNTQVGAGVDFDTIEVGTYVEITPDPNGVNGKVRTIGMWATLIEDVAPGFFARHPSVRVGFLGGAHIKGMRRTIIFLPK